jgi:hypothetical protein
VNTIDQQKRNAANHPECGSDESNNPIVKEEGKPADHESCDDAGDREPVSLGSCH